MNWRNTHDRYGIVGQLFHWGMVGLFIAQFPIGWRARALPLSPDKVELFALHKSIGMTIFALAVLRLLWRAMNPPPPHPAAMPAWERVAARAAHGGLYALMLVMPLVGWTQSAAVNFPVSIYGLFTLPNPVAPGEALGETLGAVHRTLAYLLLTLIALHAGAALNHHFRRKDTVLLRMLPLASARSRSDDGA